MAVDAGMRVRHDSTSNVIPSATCKLPAYRLSLVQELETILQSSDPGHDQSQVRPVCGTCVEISSQPLQQQVRTIGRPIDQSSV